MPASELKGYGNLVLIRHPNGFVSAYANNGEIDVKRGDSVKRGQTIAKSGQSGNVASPQLHFELRKGSQPVDPTNYPGRALDIHRIVGVSAPETPTRKAAQPRDTIGRAIGDGGSNERPAVSRSVPCTRSGHLAAGRLTKRSKPFIERATKISDSGSCGGCVQRTAGQNT